MKKLILFIIILLPSTYVFSNQRIADIKLNSFQEKSLYLSPPSKKDFNLSITCEKTQEGKLYQYDRMSDGFIVSDLNKTIDKTKKLALLIYPTVDYNNAFSHRTCKATFKKVQNDFNLFLVRPSNIKQLKNAVYDFNQIYGPIDCLWIQGHGQKDSLRIAKKENFTYKSLKKSTFELLSPSAKIFLDSCNTGKRGGLAQKLSTLTNGRKVYAATQKSYGKLIDFIDGEMKFKNLRKKNITACYKNGVMVS